MTAAPNGLTPGTEITVTLLKAPRPDVRYPATVVRDDGTHAVVTAPWAGPPVSDFGAFRFERGDVFTEHYWRDRWFSVKEVHAPDGTLKGWYCDMTRPARETPDGLAVADLDLDLWVSADRALVLRLDEDEFAASGLAETDPAAASAARAALDELEALARTEGLEGLLAR
ncbi:DUF402 domain-containing protein [Streptomyces sp. HNM0574]|uniref:DUF402 domain-containing protein n=1 Tax=Streptomyces sp. HNM0574 TaxID=2714954 RepID=UPI00146D1819|nr:DUF402 domain-containing protein [Streptomyces sp. HNM0574]NLU66065.1 DUF402 domain-containing protein [Streptomyces sp. HNM0574]